MSATRATSQLPIFWLNAEAPENMLSILVAEATYHLLMSSLNVGFD